MKNLLGLFFLSLCFSQPLRPLPWHIPTGKICFTASAGTIDSVMRSDAKIALDTICMDSVYARKSGVINFPGYANPTAKICFHAVNGVDTTVMRSDAAPYIDSVCLDSVYARWDSLSRFINASINGTKNTYTKFTGPHTLGNSKSSDNDTVITDSIKVRDLASHYTATKDTIAGHGSDTTKAGAAFIDSGSAYINYNLTVDEVSYLHGNTYVGTGMPPSVNPPFIGTPLFNVAGSVDINGLTAIYGNLWEKDTLNVDSISRFNSHLFTANDRVGIIFGNQTSLGNKWGIKTDTTAGSGSGIVGLRVFCYTCGTNELANLNVANLRDSGLAGHAGYKVLTSATGLIYAAPDTSTSGGGVTGFAAPTGLVSNAFSTGSGTTVTHANAVWALDSSIKRTWLNNHYWKDSGTFDSTVTIKYGKFITPSMYDDGTGNVVFNATGGVGRTAKGKITLRYDNISAAPGATQSIYLYDSALASAGVQLYSPAIVWEGQGWKTNSVAASQKTQWMEYLQPVQGAANPSVNLNWDAAINGGAFSNKMNLTSGGVLSATANHFSGGGYLGGTDSVNTIVTTGGINIISAPSNINIGDATNVGSIISSSNSSQDFYIGAEGVLHIETTTGTYAENFRFNKYLQVNGNIHGLDSLAIDSSAKAKTINATTGFQLNGAAASGNVLRGNGTNFVSAQLGYSDLSGTPAIPVGANPTATAGIAAINGSAATFMRSDAAPAVNVLPQILTVETVMGL